MIERFDSQTKLCQFVVENDRSRSVVEVMAAVSHKTTALSRDFNTGKVSSLNVAIEQSESVEKY